MSAKNTLLSAVAAAVVLTVGAGAASAATRFHIPEHNTFPTSWAQAQTGNYPNAVSHRYSAPAGQVLRPGQTQKTTNF
jgi:hypothetical protein